MRRPWWTWLVAASVTTTGCGSEAPGPGCAEREFFRDRQDLYEMALLGDGYVLQDRATLVGLDDDNEVVFEIEEAAVFFATTQGELLATLSGGNGALALRTWSTTGKALGERAALSDAAIEDPPTDGVLTRDGHAFVWGGSHQNHWSARLFADGRTGFETSATVAGRGAARGPNGDTYVVTATAYDEQAVYERLDLSRLDPDGEPRWTVTVHDRPDDQVPRQGLHDLQSAGGDAFVVLTVAGESGAFEVRHYGPDGTLRWTKEERGHGPEGPGRLITDAAGDLVMVDDDGGPLRLRFLDADGGVRCETHVESDGNSVTDLERRGDELFVVTVDRLTRVRLHGPP